MSGYVDGYMAMDSTWMDRFGFDLHEWIPSALGLDCNGFNDASPF